MKNYNKEFFTGLPIELECGLTIYQPTIDQIEDEDSVGYEYYESIIVALGRYNYEFQFDFEDIGLDYKDFNTYQLFFTIMYPRLFTEQKENLDELIKFNKCIKLIFGENFSLIQHKNGSLSMGDNIDNQNKDKIVMYDEKNAEEVKQAINNMFYFTKPKQRKPSNDAAKVAVKRDIAWQRKHRKVKYDLYSIMASLMWNEHYGGTREELLKLTPHQIYEGYLTIEKIKNFDNTMYGIYSGTIDSKKININDINWINKIKK